MAHAKNHDYHILPPSIWPFLAALGAFLMAFGGVLYMSPQIDAESALKQPWLLIVGTLLVLYVMYGWWADVVKESKQGDHTPVVSIGLRYGVIMFIMSEAMFFVAWFWAFFKARMYPMTEGSPWVDGTWPPAGIETFDPWHLPLINSLILLLSGCAVTWAHHAFAHDNDRKALVKGLTIAVILGLIFTGFQAYEYSHATFGFSLDGEGNQNVYGGMFYMATGFHGFHVIIGTIFLLVCLLRAMAGHFTQKQHVGFEAAAWYWHFVDVVWLFLFFAVYVWGR